MTGTHPSVTPDPTAPEISSLVRPNLSPFELEFESNVRALLTRIGADERLARSAQPDIDRLYAWPSWSMDTGLSETQERFVEAWSPERVLDAARSLRQLVMFLETWTRTHRGDSDLDEALTILASIAVL